MGGKKRVEVRRFRLIQLPTKSITALLQAGIPHPFNIPFRYPHRTPPTYSRTKPYIKFIQPASRAVNTFSRAKPTYWSSMKFYDLTLHAQAPWLGMMYAGVRPQRHQSWLRRKKSPAAVLRCLSEPRRQRIHHPYLLDAFTPDRWWNTAWLVTQYIKYFLCQA